MNLESSPVYSPTPSHSPTPKHSPTLKHSSQSSVNLSRYPNEPIDNYLIKELLSKDYQQSMRSKDKARHESLRKVRDGGSLSTLDRHVEQEQRLQQQAKQRFIIEQRHQMEQITKDKSEQASHLSEQSPSKVEYLNNKRELYRKYYESMGSYQEQLSANYINTVMQERQLKSKEESERQLFRKREQQEYVARQIELQQSERQKQRKELKAALEQQIRESRRNKELAVMETKQRVYNPEQMHNPIYNPIPHKVDIYNKYVLNEMFRFKIGQD